MSDIIEAMVDAVLVLDDGGLIVSANHATETLSGYPRKELVGTPIAALIADEGSGLRTAVRHRIEHGSILRRSVSYLVNKTGEKIPVSLTGSPILDENGVLQGIVVVARDVRELRRLLAERDAEIAHRRDVEAELRTAKISIEEQLETTRTQLLLAERRATLGTLAGGIGHELRNIAQVQVAAVASLRRALAERGNTSTVLSRILPDLDRVGEHIKLHGHRMIQLARPGPDHLLPLDLNTIVKDVVAMLRGAGTLRRIPVALSLLDPPRAVTVNRTRIEQILVNLLVNAADAIGRRTGEIAIAVRPRDERVVCSVTDTGDGIPPDVLARVFEPFFTTKPENGTGLGLSVAREIVQSYDGELTVASEPGRGATFTFDLPVDRS
ncbi:MAG TPA: ATP-binding protein [Kofleriaceae bacterium]|jgi:PAS domain S-box-containing protein